LRSYAQKNFGVFFMPHSVDYNSMCLLYVMLGRGTLVHLYTGSAPSR